MSGLVVLEVVTPHDTRRLHAPAGARLSDVLSRHHLPLNTRCGLRGLCEGCLVDLLEGELLGSLPDQRLSSGRVRACTALLPAAGTVRLRIPARSMIAHEPQVVTDYGINVSWANDPLFDSAPTPAGPALGAAVDIGTTTVVVQLVDLTSGEVLATASDFNRQMHLGDDVLTRINLCAGTASQLAQLQAAVVEQTLVPLLDRALRRAGCEADQLRGLVIAGNTTMLHLLAGVDPTPMGVAPFAAPFLDSRVLVARQLSSKLLPAAMPVHLLPSAAAYLGADVVGGILATGLAYETGPSLLVDVGTNGEIVLQHEGRLLGCATAAGPAFEGSRLTAGMRAGRGAISRLRLLAGGCIEHEVIGDAPAIGLCGSAYVDFLAEARSIGLLGATGRFNGCAHEAFASRLVPGDHDRAMVLADGRGGRRITVSESDIASLLQAKAAIAAGILTLLDRCDLNPVAIRTVHLAGGFGMHMNHAHAIACGLLPGFAPAQVRVVGNTSLASAVLALQDRGAFAELQRIAQRVKVIELNLDPGLEDRFIDQLQLPAPAPTP